MKLTPEDLEEFARRLRPTTSIRTSAWETRVTVHMGTCGIAAGAREIMKAFLKQMEDQEVPGVIFTTSGCAGTCSQEPMATVESRNTPPVIYGKLTGARVAKIFQDHIVGGAVVADYVLADGSERVD